MFTPTSSAPIRPGPRVTASESTPPSATSASASAASTIGFTSSRWWLEATSGTMPPKRSWQPPARRSRWSGSSRRPPRRRRCRHKTSLAPGSTLVRRFQPHDQGILAVVVVERRRWPAGRKPKRSYIVIALRLVVRTSSVKRASGLVEERRLARSRCPRGGGRARPRCSSGARRPHIASRPGSRPGRARRRSRGRSRGLRARARTSQRPRGLEGASLDRQHGGQVAVDESADRQRRPAVGGLSAGRRRDCGVLAHAKPLRRVVSGRSGSPAPGRWRHLGRQRADVPCRHPVCRVASGRTSTPAASNSARNRSGGVPGRWGSRQRNTLADRLGRGDERLPHDARIGLVKRPEDLRGARRSAPGAAGPAAPGRIDAERERGQRAHRRDRQPAALRERPGGRDPDSQRWCPGCSTAISPTPAQPPAASSARSPPRAAPRRRRERPSARAPPRARKRVPRRGRRRRRSPRSPCRSPEPLPVFSTRSPGHTSATPGNCRAVHYAARAATSAASITTRGEEGITYGKTQGDAAC